MPRKAKTPKRMGRPTKWKGEETLDAISHYIDTFHTKHNEQFPSIAGLCSNVLDCGKETLMVWIRDNKSEELNYQIQRLLAKQEVLLLNSGITGEFNSAITKLLLTKHGYTDKVEAIGFEGSRQQQPISITFVNASSNALINPSAISIEQGKDALEHQTDDTPTVGIG